jgi:ribA/ribD-fused uncharacterized protein
MAKEYVFFWGGPFSQWKKADMVIDGVTYNCCEQFMMAEKARFFEDEAHHIAIMSTNSPRIQKKIGRAVVGFDAEEWNEVCRDIVYKANYAKFTQNEDLKEELLATGDKTIVEASPYDTIWGIGMAKDDPDIEDESKWKGTNWLGEAIMDVREDIRFEINK